jgi:glycyl-tRNA synthetase beta subunit
LGRHALHALRRHALGVIRILVEKNLPLLLQLVQLGAPLELVDTLMSWPALFWASWTRSRRRRTGGAPSRPHL